MTRDSHAQPSFPARPGSVAADQRTAGRSLADRFRRHADSLARSGRSPLYVRLMRDAAADIDSGGPVADLFAGIPMPPGSVPALRLLAALHHLVLAGDAGELAAFFPSAGGRAPVDEVWPAARSVAVERFDWIRDRLPRVPQTNEVGRSAVLYPALLWLADRHRRPIRLLELGASAGLNLLADRYAYAVGDEVLGDAASSVRFSDPWDPAPDVDLVASAGRLEIVARAGCDLAPLDPRDREDRLTLLSYIWPDELERMERARAALDVAAADPAPVAAESAAEWLPGALAEAGDGELVVVWHSLFRQYVPARQWEALDDIFARATAGDRSSPIVWVSMEPGGDHLADVQLSVRTSPSQPALALARCGDHGPPVAWLRRS